MECSCRGLAKLYSPLNRPGATFRGFGPPIQGCTGTPRATELSGPDTGLEIETNLFLLSNA